MASSAQANANRRNAQRSTGPRSGEGKQRSSENAARHGGYAARPRAIRSGEFSEDPLEVEEFVTDIVESLAPRDALERAEATNIATAYLRLRRVERLETESIGAAGLEAPHSPSLRTMARSHDELIDPDERRAAHALKMLKQVLTISSLVESRAATSIDRAIRRYEHLRLRDLDRGASTRNEPNPTM